jgi:hypothetical protein
MSPILVDDVVKHILTSKVYDVAIETPTCLCSSLKQGESLFCVPEMGRSAEYSQLQTQGSLQQDCPSQM